MKRVFAWSFAAHFVGIVLPSLLLLILARILSPADFGVFALVNLTVAGFLAISLGPLDEVVVQSKHDDVGDFIFSAQLLVGGVLALLVALSADLISKIFGKPEMADALRLSCLLLVITPFSNIAVRMSMRRVAFKPVFLRRLVTPLANAAVAIPLALLGAGYWALIWGQLTGFAVAAIVVLVWGGWRPALNFNFGLFRDDVTFSGHMVLQNGVRWIRSQSGQAFLGAHTSLDQLGQYDIAWRLAGMPFSAIVEPVAQVMYAAMSKSIRDGESVRAFFLTSQRRVLMITISLGVLLAFNAEVLVGMLLGSQWLAVAPLFEIAIAAAVLSSFVGPNTELFKAMGKPDTMTKFMVVRAVATLIVFAILAPKGPLALAYGVLGLAVLFSPINVALTMKLLGVKPREYIVEIVTRPLVLALIVALVCLMVGRFSENSLMTAIVTISIGVSLVVAAFSLWERDLLHGRLG